MKLLRAVIVFWRLRLRGVRPALVLIAILLALFLGLLLDWLRTDTRVFFLRPPPSIHVVSSL